MAYRAPPLHLNLKSWTAHKLTIHFKHFSGRLHFLFLQLPHNFFVFFFVSVPFCWWTLNANVLWLGGGPIRMELFSFIPKGETDAKRRSRKKTYERTNWNCGLCGSQCCTNQAKCNCGECQPYILCVVRCRFWTMYGDYKFSIEPNSKCKMRQQQQRRQPKEQRVACTIFLKLHCNFG